MDTHHPRNCIHSNKQVYNLSGFINEHPGGKKVLIRVAGQDASKQFDQFHNKSILQQYHDKLYVGDVGSTEVAAPETPVVLEGLKQGETFGELIPFGESTTLSSL